MVAWLLGNDNHSGGSTSGNSLIKTIYCWHCNQISDVAINTSPNWLHGFSTDPFPSMALSVLHWLVWFPNPLAPGSDTQIHVSWGTRLTALTSLVPHPLAVSKSDRDPVYSLHWLMLWGLDGCDSGWWGCLFKVVDMLLLMLKKALTIARITAWKLVIIFLQ